MKAGVAQMVAHLIRNKDVGGSSQSSRAIFYHFHRSVKLAVFVLAWWFLSVSYQGVATTHGPFDNFADCEDVRKWVSSKTAKFSGEAEPRVNPKCWEGRPSSGSMNK